MRSRVFRLAYPACVAALVTLASIVVALGWPLELAGPALFVVTISTIFALEWVAPYIGDWRPVPSSLRADAGFLVTTFLSDAVGRALAVLLAMSLASSLRLENTWLVSLPLVGRVVLGVLAHDFFSYWFHRVSHVGNPNSPISMLLWNLHSIHHLPTRLYGLNNIRMHPLNQFCNSIIKISPLVFLGLDAEAIFLVGFLSTVLSFFAHANVELSMGPLSYFVTTPYLHRFHHSQDPSEAKNFGSTIMLWDQLFGTWHHPRGRPMDPDRIGVSNADRYPPADSLLEQVIFPLRLRMRGRSGRLRWMSSRQEDLQ